MDMAPFPELFLHLFLVKKLKEQLIAAFCKDMWVVKLTTILVKSWSINDGETAVSLRNQPLGWIS
jgi:hypothetical protein